MKSSEPMVWQYVDHQNSCRFRRQQPTAFHSPTKANWPL